MVRPFAPHQPHLPVAVSAVTAVLSSRGAGPGPARCCFWGRVCLLALLLALGAVLELGFDGAGDVAWAASAYSARQSGLEPPGGPKPMETLPGQSAGRTAEGGMGYTDAYGNTVTQREPEAPKVRKRLNPGAYGAAQREGGDRPLPDPTPRDETPVWNFR